MQAPIYVSKQIFVADAIRVGRLRALKPTYDVYLDRCGLCLLSVFLVTVICFAFNSKLSTISILASAAEGPDLLTEELDLLRNMDIAVKEERFKDAGTFNSEPFCLFFYVIVDK